jgi:hypothetical protein
MNDAPMMMTSSAAAKTDSHFSTSHMAPGF